MRSFRVKNGRGVGHTFRETAERASLMRLLTSLARMDARSYHRNNGCRRHAMPMTQRQALEVLVPYRGERIVVTTMTSAGIWPQLSDSPLDFAYIPSAMGHAPALGLGLA